MKAVCIETGDTALLQEQKEYFIFPNGESHVYVSKFDNQGAHFGCYEKDFFQEIVEEDPVRPPEPPELNPDLEHGQVYKAFLVWTSKRGFWSLEGKHYYLKQHDKVSSQVWFYEDPECKKLRGIFQKHYFTDYEPIETIPQKEEQALVEESPPELLPEEDWEQMSLF
ncbi:hypothetical protein [Alkalicoccobacillus porphyridii]|uniref:Uncharacterized protein n=1 Tax=Alkalicoccobacillus porphyridii TaxID=2597270 RepID=A0A554A0B9_9BACI|nr:hypothetical protein [Alkalicoccobacillus porphyridii]TSB47142.1 hypothetical protein FN960_09030 [Alkalicoccobacillus porphyridii]